MKPRAHNDPPGFRWGPAGDRDQAGPAEAGTPPGPAGSSPPTDDTTSSGEAGPGVEPQASPATKAIRRLLLEAFDTGKRDLPWRGESDPYRIWVSEVMLQQTRVETVIPYYKRWLQRFPSMETLAEAREEDVLLTWQGLGYYARARRLLWAARAVREEHGGSLPSSAAELQELPGVGEYTAGAVASMAFGEAVPAVDGNVRRVLARLYDLPSPAPAELRKLARGLVDPDRPGDFNQALMELGATVCQPRSPLCPSCPLQELCLARARDTVKERPARKTPRPVPQVEVAVVVALQVSGGSDGAGSEEGGEVVEEAAPAPLFFLSQRSGSGLLEGMWEFPGTEVGSGEGARNAALRLAGELGLHVVGEPRELDLVTHLFSHLKVRYRPFLFQVGGSGQDERGEWLELENLGRVPLSVAQLKIAEVTRKVVQDGWPGL